MNFTYCLVLLFSTILQPDSELLEAIRQDKYIAAGNHHTYIVEEEKYSDTRAPRGYKPFYFSYYGRHGSRYLTDAGSFVSGYVDKLASLDSLGKLSAEGKKLLEWLRWSEREHRGNEGALTQTGFQEQKGISRRFYRRYRRIFRQKSRRMVVSCSSPIARSIVSGASFALELQKNSPKLQFDVKAGQKYYLTRWDPNPELDKIEKRIGDSLFRTRFAGDEFWGRMLTDSEAAEVFPDPEMAAQDIIHILGISRCIDPEADPFSIFTEEELHAYAIAQNARNAAWFIHSTETGCYRDTNAGSHIVHDVLTKARQAIEGNDVCADLRFGHDSGVAPTLSYLHVDGYDKCTSLAEAYISWPAHKHITMACNFAFVFYRNRKGDILVKILENEKETTIPAVSPFKGPYYRWSDLEAYCNGLP